MNTIPPTWTELEEAGYVWQSRTTCKLCGKEIEWWRSPAGRWIPVERVQEVHGARMVHTMLCPNADQFQRQAVKEELKQDEKKLTRKRAGKERYRKTQARLFR
jgi:hypothetical protein